MRVRVFQLFPRFYVSAFRDRLPNMLELTPGQGPTGELVQWVDGSSFSLSAPIIEVGIKDMMDDARLLTLRDTFAYWVRFDRDNCDRVRQGLPRFHMPASYTTNEPPVNVPRGQLGNSIPQSELLSRGLLRLAEALECIGGLEGNQGDLAFALEAALLLDRLQTKHADIIEADPFLQRRVGGHLGQIVLGRLNRAFGKGPGGYVFAGLEAVQKIIYENPSVKRYLADANMASPL